MSNWKTYLTIYSILTFVPLFIYGQEKSVLELDSLMHNGRYFESRELYKKIHNKMEPGSLLFYKFRMAEFMSRKDSAAIYMKGVLKDYPDIMGTQIPDVYSLLFDLYIDLRDYENGEHTYQRTIRLLKENPDSVRQNEIQERLKGAEDRLLQLKNAVSQPPIRIRRKPANDSLRLEGALKCMFTAKFNGIPLKAIFDTGTTPHCIMSKRKAEQLGIRYDTLEVNKMVLNKELPAFKTLVDSVEIGNIMLYNIPAWIHEDGIEHLASDSICNNPAAIAAATSAFFNVTAPIVIGLPTMQLIGKLRIDYENRKISFPTTGNCPDRLKAPNLFVYKGNLYTHLKVNGKDFTGNLDTGAEKYIDIDTAFFEKYRKDLPTDSITSKDELSIVMCHRLWNNIPYTIPYKPVVMFDSQPVRPFTKRSIRIYSMQPIWPSPYFDGVIGYQLFRRIGKKVLLDFDNMRLEAEE